MEKIYLTVEQAITLLPKLKEDVQRLMSLNKSTKILESLSVSYEDEYSTNVHNAIFKKKFHEVSFDFYNLLTYLHDKGVIVKDIDNGIINFYSLFQDREIILYWNVSRPEILHWHEVGYTSKKPISMIQNDDFMNENKSFKN